MKVKIEMDAILQRPVVRDDEGNIWFFDGVAWLQNGVAMLASVVPAVVVDTFSTRK